MLSLWDLSPQLSCHTSTLTALLHDTFKLGVSRAPLSVLIFQAKVCVSVCVHLFVCDAVQELMRQNAERANMISEEDDRKQTALMQWLLH